MRIFLETFAIYLPTVYYIILFLMTLGGILESRSKVSMGTFLIFLFFMFLAPIMISVCVFNVFHCGIMSIAMIALLSLVRVNVRGINVMSIEIIFILGNVLYLAYLLGTLLN